MHVFVAPFAIRVLEGGFWAYITDPIFIAEPFLFTLALADWITQRKIKPQLKSALLIGLVSAFGVFTIAFLFFVPTWQNIVAQYSPP